MTRKWWHEKVAYQIYPKSFMDTNGDGVGDLRGIISKLDYLQELGIEILWISPVYCSPFVDQGYDISDYYNIDPKFGTMEDMEELLTEAKKRGIHVLMDLVVNHCSDQHEWFQKALADPEGPYADYFYFREGKDGKEPCNWRSYFGGSAWEKVPGTDKYYLHLFAKEQPDLNWENPVVRSEIYKMINWWLDKGLSGFRIDAIINIKKDLLFRDLPADRDDGMGSCFIMLDRTEGPGKFLHELKQETFDRYDAFTVGELFNYKEEDLPLYIGEAGYFSTIFDFSSEVAGTSEKGWYDRRKISPDEYIEILRDSQRKIDKMGFMANIIENHDEPRGCSRYLPEGECTEAGKKMLAVIQMMLKGLPFMFQGQEIGMENCDFGTIEAVDDINSKDEYQVALRAGLSEKEALKVIERYSRDNSRTPFQWDDTTEAGFTSGTPWLMVNPNYKSVNAKDQLSREDSVFHCYKKLIALRKDPAYKETIVYGAFESILKEEQNLFAFYRRSEEQTLLVIANYQNEERTVSIDGKVKACLFDTNGASFVEDGKITLKGYQAVILEME